MGKGRPEAALAPTAPLEHSWANTRCREAPHSTESRDKAHGKATALSNMIIVGARAQTRLRHWHTNWGNAEAQLQSTLGCL